MAENIRNFCIVAHIDHGKSTLADRLLQITHAVPEREFHELMLDDMELERERGITIKASCVTMFYEKDGRQYHLNLIDTPGHVDFSYEVSRALKACEGAVLLVDSTQGVEAQTVVNFNLAREQGLAILPAVTKIDLPTARPIETMEEMGLSLHLNVDDILAVSGKTGQNVRQLVEAVIERVPPPKGDPEAPLRAMIFDSFYDEYRGVVVYARVVDGQVKRGDEILMMGTSSRRQVTEVGIFGPSMTPRDSLTCGEVGYLIAGIKTIRDVRIGDTVTLAGRPASTPLPGYKEPQPVVFCGLFPQNSDEFPTLRSALEKLSLNDSSFDYEPESSEALGFGYRCGFLGLLHMEIVQERLERENDISIVQTAPNVSYEVLTTKGETVRIDRPSQTPPPSEIAKISEPWVRLTVMAPTEYVGSVMKLVEGCRGTYKNTEFFSDRRTMIHYEVPLEELIYGFFDHLKSATRGYGTMDYELLGYREADLVKVDVLVNEVRVDAFSSICHRDEAERRGRRIVKLLRKNIDRHLFAIPIQAAIGGRIIARETISPVRKDVTAKCYGGDVTRKRKLLEKQKAGKKRMKSVGSVQISQKAFLAVLEASGEEEG